MTCSNWRSATTGCSYAETKKTAWPERMPQVLHIAQAYSERGMPGIFRAQEDLASADVAPQPGHSGRHHWQSRASHKGPVGLLCSGLYQVGARLNVTELSVCHWAHHPLSVLNAPFQSVFISYLPSHDSDHVSSKTAHARISRPEYPQISCQA